jgi:hypothetical protein
MRKTQLSFREARAAHYGQAQLRIASRNLRPAQSVVDPMCGAPSTRPADPNRKVV